MRKTQRAAPRPACEAPGRPRGAREGSTERTGVCCGHLCSHRHSAAPARVLGKRLLCSLRSPLRNQDPKGALLLGPASRQSRPSKSPPSVPLPGPSRRRASAPPGPAGDPPAPPLPAPLTRRRDPPAPPAPRAWPAGRRQGGGGARRGAGLRPPRAPLGPAPGAAGCPSRRPGLQGAAAPCAPGPRSAEAESVRRAPALGGRRRAGPGKAARPTPAAQPAVSRPAGAHLLSAARTQLRRCRAGDAPAPRAHAASPQPHARPGARSPAPPRDPRSPARSLVRTRELARLQPTPSPGRALSVLAIASPSEPMGVGVPFTLEAGRG